MMRLKNSDSKQQIIQRLRRLEGQVRGVQTMIEEERDCREVMQQLSAMRAALQSVSRTFAQEYAASCLLEMEQSPGAENAQQRQQIVQDLITFLDKSP